MLSGQRFEKKKPTRTWLNNTLCEISARWHQLLQNATWVSFPCRCHCWEMLCQVAFLSVNKRFCAGRLTWRVLNLQIFEIVKSRCVSVYVVFVVWYTLCCKALCNPLTHCHTFPRLLTNTWADLKHKTELPVAMEYMIRGTRQKTSLKHVVDNILTT